MKFLSFDEAPDLRGDEIACWECDDVIGVYGKGVGDKTVMRSMNIHLKLAKCGSKIFVVRSVEGFYQIRDSEEEE